MKFCFEPVKKIQLCKKGGDYRANAPPKQFKSLGDPDPTILTPILHLQNIPQVNDDKKKYMLSILLLRCTGIIQILVLAHQKE